MTEPRGITIALSGEWLDAAGVPDRMPDDDLAEIIDAIVRDLTIDDVTTAVEEWMDENPKQPKGKQRVYEVTYSASLHVRVLAKKDTKVIKKSDPIAREFAAAENGISGADAYLVINPDDVVDMREVEV